MNTGSLLSRLSAPCGCLATFDILPYKSSARFWPPGKHVWDGQLLSAKSAGTAGSVLHLGTKDTLQVCVTSCISSVARFMASTSTQAELLYIFDLLIFS